VHWPFLGSLVAIVAVIRFCGLQGRAPVVRKICNEKTIVQGIGMRSLIASNSLAVLMAVVASSLIGCQSSGLARRKAERIEAYHSLDAEARARVDRGEIQAGMDKSAVFIAWGKPAEVRTVGGPGDAEMVWDYYKRFTREHPRWVPRYDRNGYYSTFDYQPVMTSHSYLARMVVFKGGRVVRWQNFSPPAR